MISRGSPFHSSVLGFKRFGVWSLKVKSQVVLFRVDLNTEYVILVTRIVTRRDDQMRPPWEYTHKDQTTTPGTTSPTLCEQWMGSLTSHRVMYKQGLWDGAYGLSSLLEKTRKCNHLQMSLQRQHFLFSYLKCWSGGVWTRDLPHGSPALYQLS